MLGALTDYNGGVSMNRVSLVIAFGLSLAMSSCSSNEGNKNDQLAGGPSTAGSPTAAGGGVNPAGGTGGSIGFAGGGVGAAAGSGAGGQAATSGAANVAGEGSFGGQPGGLRPFPQHRYGTFCSYPKTASDASVQSAFQVWKDVTVTSDGAGGFLRVKKPDSGAIIGSTASEGIGYGMILAVYMADQALFDGLWRYEQLHLDAQGLMHWDIGPTGEVSGMGSASDGDIDIAWALIMADRQWGGQGSLDKTYLVYAQDLIDRIWRYEVDHTRGEMLMAGDTWGNVDITNPSYFAPAYFRAFGRVTNQVANWNKVIDRNYAILSLSLNTTNGNSLNGLAPAWCNSKGEPVVAFAGAPTHFQNDATRVPFRIGQDYCYTGDPRAKAYLSTISAFYDGVGVAKIVDGYNLDGSPHPERSVAGSQAASFVGPAGVAAMSDAKYQAFIDQAYAAVATQKLTAGTIYYQKSWTALSLLMLSGNLVDFTAP